MHVAARTGLSSRRIRLIMSGRALGRAESQRFLARLDIDQVIVQDEAVQRPWEIMRGLDAVLLLAPAPGRHRARHGSGTDLSSLPLLWAHAAGVPVIAEATAPLDGLVNDGRSGLIFASGDVNGGCERLSRLYDDRALGHRLAEAARRMVSERFHIDSLCQRLHDAWRQAIERRGAAHIDTALPSSESMLHSTA
jgi:glycosyltransferase involved in cell wall biosynthesis